MRRKLNLGRASNDRVAKIHKRALVSYIDDSIEAMKKMIAVEDDDSISQLLQRWNDVTVESDLPLEVKQVTSELITKLLVSKYHFDSIHALSDETSFSVWNPYLLRQSQMITAEALVEYDEKYTRYAMVTRVDGPGRRTSCLRIVNIERILEEAAGFLKDVYGRWATSLLRSEDPRDEKCQKYISNVRWYINSKLDMYATLENDDVVGIRNRLLSWIDDEINNLADPVSKLRSLTAFSRGCLHWMTGCVITDCFGACKRFHPVD